MEKEKAGLSTSAQDAIADAAKANVDAAMKVASSAVTAFVDTLAGGTKKARGGRNVPRTRRLLPHLNGGRQGLGKSPPRQLPPAGQSEKRRRRSPFLKTPRRGENRLQKPAEVLPRNLGRVQRAARAEERQLKAIVKVRSETN